MKPFANPASQLYDPTQQARWRTRRPHQKPDALPDWHRLLSRLVVARGNLPHDLCLYGERCGRRRDEGTPHQGRRRSDKLTHLCSAKLTHRFTAGDAASSFQVVERFAFGATDRKGACGLATYARALSTSFQSCREGRRRLTPGCRAIIARAMLSPTGSASKPQ